MSGLWGDGGPYQTWVGFLRRWAALEPVDPATLPALPEEQYDSDTWVRLTEHLTSALNTRLVAWAEHLVRALNEARDEFSYGRELAQARTGLHGIRALAAHPGLPESLRTALTELVDNQITQVQAQLEQNLDAETRRGTDPRLVERRRRTLRDNALTATFTVQQTQDTWAYDPAAPPRRRIVPG
ncbi:hypothetical protein AQI88_23240 [Streptomyces cellostaticus]|uniref:Uncharacterized protein n=1 Tax=Streptomyces cellostaticus TaxID=67285 RepID=A0A101NJF5_9ACTN|nr:hypothetical protein [Streptomyces cellostaticus]KUM94082.1 hypothetical protein AQI88_23240 [Streptomyces cellostaticus]GHI05315.1 hypothetical protein Scel_36360 [Streptomyces cellostaticus]